MKNSLSIRNLGQFITQIGETRYYALRSAMRYKLEGIRVVKVEQHQDFKKARGKKTLLPQSFRGVVDAYRYLEHYVAV